MDNVNIWLEIASHATLPWIFPLKKANGAQKIFGLRIFSSDLEISEAFMMSHEVSFFFFSFVSDSKIMHISVLFFSNKGLSILASTGFYHSSPLLFLIVFSLTHSPSMMLWENKGPVDCLFFVKFWTEWTRCINSYYCFTVHVLCFNFRRTLGNSLYCLPNRTGNFTSDVVRACAYNKPATVAMYNSCNTKY